MMAAYRGSTAIAVDAVVAVVAAMAAAVVAMVAAVVAVVAAVVAVVAAVGGSKEQRGTAVLDRRHDYRPDSENTSTPGMGSHPQEQRH